jgi:hypothetical protein
MYDVVNPDGDEVFSGTSSSTVTAKLLAPATICVTVTDDEGCSETDCFGITAADARVAQLVDLNGLDTYAQGYAVCNDSTVTGFLTNGYSDTAWVVEGLTGIVAVSTEHSGGAGHSLALKNNGTVWAWGPNDYGQLGDGTNNASETPVQVSGLSDVVAIATSGENFSVALKSDGTVWAWGRNDFSEYGIPGGTLGDGSTDNSNVPVQVSGLTGITAISCNALSLHTLALKSDSTVWSWGINWAGQLGDGTTTDRLTPVQVSGLSDATAIAAGYIHSVAIKADSTVVIWGAQEETTPVYSGLSDVTAVACGWMFTLALKSDSSTVMIGAVGGFELEDVTHIASGYTDAAAVKSDGTVWCVYGLQSESIEPFQAEGLCLVGTASECTAPTVSAGSDESTYFGYSADETVIRTATVDGGTSPYSYSWTMNRALLSDVVNADGDEVLTGTSSATVTATMIEPAEICVTVTDADGCEATDCFTITAEDARCFNGGQQKVAVCHMTNSQSNPCVSICVASAAVDAHLTQHGDFVGNCTSDCEPPGNNKTLSDGRSADVDVFPSPTGGFLNVTFEGDATEQVSISIVNLLGQILYTKTHKDFDGSLQQQLDVSSYKAGFYCVIVGHGDEVQTWQIVVN